MDIPITMGRGEGKREVTVHEVQGHSGGAKEITVQVNQILSSAQVQLSAMGMQPWWTT